MWSDKPCLTMLELSPSREIDWIIAINFPFLGSTYTRLQLVFTSLTNQLALFLSASLSDLSMEQIFHLHLQSSLARIFVIKDCRYVNKTINFLPSHTNPVLEYQLENIERISIEAFLLIQRNILINELFWFKNLSAVETSIFIIEFSKQTTLQLSLISR